MQIITDKHISAVCTYNLNETNRVKLFWLISSSDFPNSTYTCQAL